MFITKTQIAQGRRSLEARSRDSLRRDRIDVRARAISEAWRLVDRMPAYKTAVANVAYIWRDSTPVDRFGPMPAKFAERRCELRHAGLILPPNAPVWASERYRIWEEADAAAAATGDAFAMAAWHVMLEIPVDVPAASWHRMVTMFVERELAAKGAVVAWAIHALEGDDGGWLVSPHVHLIVTGRHWRHDKRHGTRHPAWIGSMPAQLRLASAWRQRCVSARSSWDWLAWRDRDPALIDGTVR